MMKTYVCVVLISICVYTSMYCFCVYISYCYINEAKRAYYRFYYITDNHVIIIVI